MIEDNAADAVGDPDDCQCRRAPPRWAALLAHLRATALNMRLVRDGLPGWAYRTRTGESVGELSDWNCVTTLAEVGAILVAETLRVPAA
jgi:hypothetical protein